MNSEWINLTSAYFHEHLKMRNYSITNNSPNESDYPFGMVLVGRNWDVGNDYRYGFNGMENDDETLGNANALDFGARIYNPRLGMWLSTDPLATRYPSSSPYAFCLGNPIFFIDPSGKGAEVSILNAGQPNAFVSVTINIVLYSDIYTETELATMAVQFKADIEHAYNNPYIYDPNTGTVSLAPINPVTNTGATTDYGGTSIPTIFTVNFTIVTPAEGSAAVQSFKDGGGITGDISTNYIKVTNGYDDDWSSMPGGFYGFWNMSADPTTILEEVGHMLGWFERPMTSTEYNNDFGLKDDLEQDEIHTNPFEQGYPFSIMSRKYYADKNSGSGYSSLILNEATRVVLQSDIDNLNGGVGILNSNPSPSGNDSGLKPVGGLANFSRKKLGPDSRSNPYKN